MFGGASYAEKRARQSLLEEEEAARMESNARRDMLINLRRSVLGGRRSLLGWYGDGGIEDTIGA
jgi:hypothetical protein